MAVLGKLDLLVFTAGIGENSPMIREKSLEGMESLGIHLEKKKNDGLRAKEAVISTDDSPVKVLVVPTNEELVIALDTAEIVGQKN